MKRVIVARFNEDIEWTKDIPSDWDVVVVQKDVDTPNVGREASSYFWAIQKYYDEIKDDDSYIFVQGRYDDHTPDLFDRFNNIYGFQGFGVSELISDGQGMPNHPVIPVAEYYEDWFFRPFPGSVSYYPGAQFGVRGKRIKKYKKKYYEFMQGEMSRKDAPYVMERLWKTLFTK